MSQNIVKKISIKTAVEGGQASFKGLTETTPVLRILGIVNAVDVGEHAQYGRFLKFRGEFIATDLREGTEVISAVAFLPSPVDEMLFDAFQKAGAGVEFGFDISVKPRPDLPIGYEYVVQSLVEAKPSNPMLELQSRIARNVAPVVQGVPGPELIEDREYNPVPKRKR